jgi:hypothetical protein
MMADGSYKNIEKIEVGDWVRAFDRGSGEARIAPVTEVFRHLAEEMHDYYMVINDFLRVTPNHRLLTNDGWKFAGGLRVGDVLSAGENGGSVVYSVDRVFEKVPTFNILTLKLQSIIIML